MALVQAEPKKKPAPPPPPGSGHETPSRTSEEEDGEGVGKARSEENRSDVTEPKPYNPFEEEDEEEEESAAAQKSTPEQEQSETAAKPLHPWYGITPTSSPKAKKRPAPRAPSASPLGELPHTPLSLLHNPCAAPWRLPLPRAPLHHPGMPGLYAGVVVLGLVLAMSSLPTGAQHLQTRPFLWRVPSVLSEERQTLVPTTAPSIYHSLLFSWLAPHPFLPKLSLCFAAHHSISRLSHSEPSSSTPSPALSLESINSESSAKVLGDADEASVPKSSSEPTVHTPTATKTSTTDTLLASVSSNESPAAPASLSTNSSFSSSSELASFSGEVQPSTPHASRSVSTSSLRTSPSRLPPKPPAGGSPTPILLASDGGAGSPKNPSSPKPQLKVRW